MSGTSTEATGNKANKLTPAEQEAKKAQKDREKAEKAAQKTAEAEAKKTAVLAEKERKKAEAAAKKAADTEAKKVEQQRVAAEKAAKKAAENEAKRVAKIAEEERKKKEAADKKAAEEVAKKARLEREATEKAKLPGKLISLIRSQRHASEDSYPVIESRLVALADFGVSEKDLKAALKHLDFVAQVATCSIPPKPAAQKKAYFLKSDLEEASSQLVLRGLELAVVSKRTAAAKTTAITAGEIAAVFVSGAESKTQFAKSIELAADKKSLPIGVAWLWIKGARLYFLASDIEPQGVRVTTANTPISKQPVTDHAPTHHTSNLPDDFAAQFTAAFERVDARTGRRNFLKLLDLRHELAPLSREVFDTGLRELRIADRYTLESSQGGSVHLTEAERAAGIQEGSSLLVYVSRK